MKTGIQLTKQEDIGVTTPTTYKSYIGMSGQPYKPFIMIGELIDNSISSFENKFNGEWTKKDGVLEIEITLDFRGNIEDSKESKLGFKHHVGSYITVNDNGFGMDKETLRSAFILDNDNNSISDKNVWGRGMKQCAYFFGQDLTVETNDENEAFKVVKKFTDEDVGIFTPYRIQPERSERNVRGTCVKIENIYEDRAFSKAVLSGVMESLSWRYVNYLKERKLLVKYNYINNDTKNKWISGELKILEEPVLILDDKTKQKLLNLGIDNVKENIEKEFNNLIKDGTKEGINTKIAEKTYQNLKMLLLASLGGEQDTKFESQINLNVKSISDGKNITIPFKYWALPNNTEDKNAGIRMYEGHRAITHVSTKDKNTGPWTDWVKVTDKSWRIDKQFAGELDLKLIGAKPTVDKSMFSIPEDIMNSLKTQIWTIYKVFYIFMRLIKKKEVINQTVVDSEIDIGLIIESTREFSPEGGIRIIEGQCDEKERLIVAEYDTDDGTLEVRVEISHADNPSHIMDNIKTDEDNVMRIVVYRKKKFWNIIKASVKDDENIFVADVIVPLIHLIVNSSIKMKNKNLKFEIAEDITKFARGDE